MHSSPKHTHPQRTTHNCVDVIPSKLPRRLPLIRSSVPAHIASAHLAHRESRSSESTSNRRKFSTLASRRSSGARAKSLRAWDEGCTSSREGVQACAGASFLRVFPSVGNVLKVGEVAAAGCCVESVGTFWWRGYGGVYDGRCVLGFLTLCTELRSCLDLRSQSVIMYALGVHTVAGTSLHNLSHSNANAMQQNRHHTKCACCNHPSLETTSPLTTKPSPSPTQTQTPSRHPTPPYVVRPHYCTRKHEAACIMLCYVNFTARRSQAQAPGLSWTFVTWHQRPKTNKSRAYVLCVSLCVCHFVIPRVLSPP